ncbi:hypothetical protein GJ496_004945 [Pomphorhynchus laevis]|nr:hypothetical protein GJ496_004945 [Pomphorhynchus laevis]
MKYSGHLFGLGICSMYAPTSTSSLYTQELHQSTMAAQAAAASGAATTTTPTDSSMLSFNVSPGTQSSGSTVSAITMNSSASTMLPSISDGNTSIVFHNLPRAVSINESVIRTVTDTNR